MTAGIFFSTVDFVSLNFKVNNIIYVQQYFVCQKKRRQEPVHEKTNNLGSDQVQHKLGCTITNEGYKLEISDLRRRGIVLSVERKQRH